MMTMNAETILNELKSLGRESTRRVLLNHGVKDPCYGVRIADLKPIQKRVKRDHGLALALYDTGVYDAMNQFIISVGCHVKPLTALALQTGEEIGRVEVDMGNTACKVPYAPDYIRKVEQRGLIGRKRKTVKC